MQLRRIQKILKAEVLSGSEDPHAGDMNLRIAYCADLMSDVLAFSLTDSLLITGLTNAQVIRTAEIAGIKAIAFVQNKRPSPETILLASGRKIPLLATEFSMFDTCGRLYEKGLRSVVLQRKKAARNRPADGKRD